MEPPAVIDQEGSEQDWVWLNEAFGEVAVERAGAGEGHRYVYRVISLQDTLGPAAQVAKVVDQTGEPLAGVRVVRHWPDAPQLTDVGSPASMWRQRGVHGPTNANGELGFGMGKEDYYAISTKGPAAVWVADPAGVSDLVTGLGMIEFTNHRHLDIVFQREAMVSQVEPAPVSGGPVSPTAPVPSADEQWDQVFEKLDQIIAVLEARVDEEEIEIIAT